MREYTRINKMEPLTTKQFMMIKQSREAYKNYLHQMYKQINK